MRLEDLVLYTRNDIERMARDYIATRPDFPRRPQTKIDYLLESTENVFLEFMPGLVEKHNVEGAICKKLLSCDIVVLIDEQIADSSDTARYNAAVGEELAHIHIHRGLLEVVDSVEAFLEVQADPYWPQYEMDARNYSAAIRMPCELIALESERLYPSIVDEFGFGQTRQIQMTLSTRMAKQFIVTIDEMHRRLLSWPCEIYRRVERSVLACSPTLFGVGPLEKIVPFRVSQRSFWDLD